MSAAGSAGRTIRSVVVFDLDDTLYLERHYVESGLRAVGCWAEVQLGIPGAGEDLVDRFRRGGRGHLFDELLADAGVQPRRDLIQRMLQAYRLHRPAIGLAADSIRYFARRPADCAVAIITDGFIDAQKRKIRALGLHALGVEQAICTDRWGRADWKPSMRAFICLQSCYDLPEQAFTYVADNPAKDFHAPKRMGWKTVQVHRSDRIDRSLPDAIVAADVEIDSLDSFPSA